MKNIIQIIIFACFAIIMLGLIAVLFSIGLVVLWYLLIIGLIIWGVRRLYYFFKGQKPPPISEQFYYYSTRNSQTSSQNPKSKRGRVIDYDEFKDK